MRLVHHHQIPVRGLQLGLQFVGAGELVHPGDQQRLSFEHRLAEGGLHQLPGQQLEPEPEPVEQLLLPLLHQAARRDDQASGEVTPQHQLLDVEPGHDRLPGTWVVGQQEPQRGAGQQLAVDRADLVRQRLQITGVDRDHRIELGRHPDPQRLYRQPEPRRIAVERVRPGDLHQRQRRLKLTIEQTLVGAAGVILVGNGEGVTAVPLDPFHHHVAVDDPSHPGARSDLLQRDTLPVHPRGHRPPLPVGHRAPSACGQQGSFRHS